MSIINQDDNEPNNESSYWDLMPEPILLKIFFQLPITDLLNGGSACKRWYKISQDDFIWRKIFQRDFKVEKNIGLKPGKLEIHFYFFLF